VLSISVSGQIEPSVTFLQLLFISRYHFLYFSHFFVAVQFHFFSLVIVQQLFLMKDNCCFFAIANNPNLNSGYILPIFFKFTKPRCYSLSRIIPCLWIE